MFALCSDTARILSSPNLAGVVFRRTALPWKNGLPNAEESKLSPKHDLGASAGGFSPRWDSTVSALTSACSLSEPIACKGFFRLLHGLNMAISYMHAWAHDRERASSIT